MYRLKFILINLIETLFGYSSCTLLNFCIRTNLTHPFYKMCVVIPGVMIKR